MFEAESMDVIRAWEHPYYKEVLEPDEYNFVDKKAEDKGLVAQSIGSTVAIVEEGKSVFGEEGGKERKQWEQFMKDNVKL